MEVRSVFHMDIQDGNIVGYKEIFVARGFSQKEGIDYEETFATVMSQVYIGNPLVVETHDKHTHVCKLKKALYKLRSTSEGTHGIEHTVT